MTNLVRIYRQVHLVAGSMLVLGLILQEAYPVFAWLPRLVAFGLFLHALSGFCPMEKIVGACPWNKES